MSYARAAFEAALAVFQLPSEGDQSRRCPGLWTVIGLSLLSPNETVGRSVGRNRNRIVFQSSSVLTVPGRH